LKFIQRIEGWDRDGKPHEFTESIVRTQKCVTSMKPISKLSLVLGKSATKFDENSMKGKLGQRENMLAQIGKVPKEQVEDRHQTSTSKAQHRGPEVKAKLT
jgi:hypothetical protein